MLLLKLENFIEIKVVLSNTSLLSLLLDILSWVFQIPLDEPDVIKCEVHNSTWQLSSSDHLHL